MWYIYAMWKSGSTTKSKGYRSLQDCKNAAAWLIKNFSDVRDMHLYSTTEGHRYVDVHNERKNQRFPLR